MNKERFHHGDLGRVVSEPNTSKPPANAQPCLPWETNPEEADKRSLRSILENHKKAVEEQPDSAWAWYRYGDTLLGLGRVEEALPALRKAVELSPETVLFHYDLGLALYDLNESEAASQEFAEIVANDPQLQCASSGVVLAAITNLALSQEKLGKRDEAIQTLLPALDTAVGILFNLGFLHFRAKRFDLALPYAHAAYILRPNNEDIVHQYGAVLNELERPKEAVKILKLATQLEPKCASAWYDLGLAHARLKSPNQARSCFRKSLQLAPDHAWPYYDLACLDALKGNRNRAFDNLMQAVVCGFKDVGHLRRDADFRSLRRDARWKTLIATIGNLDKSNN